MKVSTEIDNNFGYEKMTQLVDNIPLNWLGETFRQPDILNEHVKLKIKVGKSVLIKFRNMTRQKTVWFVQYKDNREIIVAKRIICYLNPFTTTTKFFILILK